MEPREYFIMMCGENGDVRINHLTKTELLKRIEEKYYGDHLEFVDYIPDSDPQSWGTSVIIIKGNIVVPQPITKVVKFTIA